ncbi:inositol monophosphatase family protein [Planococcus sp. APC 4015]|nr:inositol monophosphatase family protein [Planococcus sp. APC 4015]
MTSPASPASFDAPYAGDLSDDLALALRLADAADAASMSRFDSPDLDVQAKPDATFVTDADLATEEAIRAILTSERPDDGVLGEEFGTTGEGARQWIIDPIDGTHNYLKGIPMWTVLIALAIDGVPRVGVVSQPAIGRRWWAASGLGAWTNTPDGDPKRITVSNVDDVARASVSFQSIEQWRDAGELPALERLTSAVWRDRGYGDAWPYMLLAEGRLELVAEFGVKEYDIAALAPIVIEAGGAFTAFSGAHSLSERSSLATNRVLHDDFLRLLHSPA